MTNWNRPKTDPEDALLRSLMAQVVGQEGAALDGELDALGADPAAAPPEGADSRCRETIRQAMARRSRRLAMGKLRRWWRRWRPAFSPPCMPAATAFSGPGPI